MIQRLGSSSSNCSDTCHKMSFRHTRRNSMSCTRRRCRPRKSRVLPGIPRNIHPRMCHNESQQGKGRAGRWYVLSMSRRRIFHNWRRAQFDRLRSPCKTSRHTNRSSHVRRLYSPALLCTQIPIPARTRPCVHIRASPFSDNAPSSSAACRSPRTAGSGEMKPDRPFDIRRIFAAQSSSPYVPHGSR